MSREQRYGINQARPILGDLVTAAQQGTDIILTRNGRPAARITAYVEDTMRTITAKNWVLSADVSAGAMQAMAAEEAGYQVGVTAGRWASVVSNGHKPADWMVALAARFAADGIAHSLDTQ